MNPVEHRTIGEMVAEDYRIAQVFNHYKIDFCCNGNRGLADAARDKNVDPNVLIAEIEAVRQQGGAKDANDYQSWPLDLLADYIQKKHHRYVEERIPVINQYLDKICQVHGNQHPELHAIAEHFRICGGELTAHMKKEEFMLFPLIRKMVNTPGTGEKISQPNAGIIETRVKAMMAEHESEGERFRQIEALSKHYTTPEDGCNTYRVTLGLLQEFEADLHLHIHLENNILFPKAIEMERAL